jgi:hypothetical protein
VAVVDPSLVLIGYQSKPELNRKPPIQIGKTNKRGPVDESRRAIEERLLAEMLDTSSLFFSYDFDITHTQQRLERVAGSCVGGCRTSI